MLFAGISLTGVRKCCIIQVVAVNLEEILRGAEKRYLCFLLTAFSTVTGVAIDELPNTHMGLR